METLILAAAMLILALALADDAAKEKPRKPILKNGEPWEFPRKEA